MDKKYLECLEILELKVGFTLDELKKKWLELSKKYHPDKHATADEILKKLAEEQYKRINEAYTYLKENYGRNQNQYQYQYSSENKPKEERKSRMETDPDFYLENCDILNEENIRPLTDKVNIKEPNKINYSVDFDYYIEKDNETLVNVIKSNVDKTVQEYVNWQKEKIGKDINPDELIKRLKIAGVKRVVLRSPVFQKLNFNQVGINNGITSNYQGVEEL